MPLLSDLLTRLEPLLPYLEPISWVLVHVLWQGMVLAGLLALGLWLLRDRSAPVRYALSVGTLTALLMLPVATVALIGTPASQFSPEATTPVLTDAEQRAFETALAAEALMAPEAAPATPPASQPADSASWTMALPILAAFWLMGVAVLLLRLVGSLWYVRRLLTQGVSPLPEAWAVRAEQVADRVGVHGAVRFVASYRATVPMVIGWWRPVVLLPASMLSGMPPAYIEAILMHEMAHIRRHDALAGWLQVVAETLLFFHPATWWISRRIRMEREHCCDDRVVQLTGKRTTYARALTQLETLQPSAGHPAPAATDGSLLHRIRRILGQPVQQRLVNSWRAAAGMAATAVLGLLAAGLLLASAPATSDDAPAADASTFAGFTLPDLLTDGPAALGVSPPATHDTTDHTFSHEIVLGQDTLHFNDPVLEQHADSSATVRFRGEPSVRVFIRDDSLRALRTEDFAFMADSLRQGNFAALMRGFATISESLGTLGQGLEALMDSLDTNPKAFEGHLWWEDTPGTLRDTLELRSSGQLLPKERRARMDSLMAQARALWQPSPEQQARRDSLVTQARALYEPSPEQQARIDSLRSRLQSFAEPTPERRARMDSLTAMLRDLQQPSAEARARADSLMARAQALVRPTEEQQAQLDSLEALMSRLNQPSSEQLRQRAEALREQAERLEAQAQALEQQTPPSPPTPPDPERQTPPPPPIPPNNQNR